MDQVTVDQGVQESREAFYDSVNAAEAKSKARSKNLSSLFSNPKTRPKVLFAGFMVTAGVLFGGAKLFSGGHDQAPLAEPSKVGAMPALDTSVGNEASAQYTDLIKAQNVEAANAAKQNGQSHIDAPSALPDLSGADASLPEPAAQPTHQAPAAAPQAPQAQSVAQTPSIDRDRASAMAAQAQALMAAWAPKGHTSSNSIAGYTSAAAGPQVAQASIQGSPGPIAGKPIDASGALNPATTATAAATQATPAFTGPTTTVKAGTMLYAVLDMNANSDEPGPVMATIVSGPYKDSKVIGDFTKGKETLSLKFNVLSPSFADTSAPINALAVDINKASTAIAADVDHHYFERYGTMFLAAFIKGYGQAAAQSGATTISNSAGTVTTNPVTTASQQLKAGLGEVGTAFGQDLQKQGAVPVTVKVPAGTAVGIMFTADTKLPAKQM